MKRMSLQPGKAPERAMKIQKALDTAVGDKKEEVEQVAEPDVTSSSAITLPAGLQ